TWPRREARPTMTSCAAPFSTTATRLSLGVTLNRISSLTTIPVSCAVLATAAQQFGSLVQGQAHHSGVAALQMGDECGRPPLNSIPAGLAVRLTAVDVGLDLLRRQVRHRDSGDTSGLLLALMIQQAEA